jgi:hypothetical protein
MTQLDIEKIITKLEEEKEKIKTWHSELSAVDYCFDKAIEIVKKSVKDEGKVKCTVCGWVGLIDEINVEIMNGCYYYFCPKCKNIETFETYEEKCK